MPGCSRKLARRIAFRHGAMGGVRVWRGSGRADRVSAGTADAGPGRGACSPSASFTPSTFLQVRPASLAGDQARRPRRRLGQRPQCAEQPPRRHRRSRRFAARQPARPRTRPRAGAAAWRGAARRRDHQPLSRARRAPGGRGRTVRRGRRDQRRPGGARVHLPRARRQSGPRGPGGSAGGNLRLRPRGGSTGAEVVVTLPRSLLGAHTPLSTPAETLPRMRILVVDDDAVNRQAMVLLLEREGHQIVAVENGLEAMERLGDRDNTFDAIVTDLQMPRLGGRAMYEQLVSSRPLVAKRFVFVTGDQARGETRAFLENCGQPSVTKPYDLGDLINAIGTVSRKK